MKHRHGTSLSLVAALASRVVQVTSHAPSFKTLDLQNDMEARYRVMRIARGSGRHPQEVLQLLDEHKRFSKMVGKMGKLGKGKGANWEQEQMKRNPKQMMAQLQVRSPPSSLLLLPRPPVLPV